MSFDLHHPVLVIIPLLLTLVKCAKIVTSMSIACAHVSVY